MNMIVAADREWGIGKNGDLLDNIPEDMGCGLISYVSGMSPSIFEQILSGKTGYDLMMEKLDSERYAVIH